MLSKNKKRDAKELDAETPVLPLRRSTRHQMKASLPMKGPIPEPIHILSSPLPVAESSEVSSVTTPARTQAPSPIITLPSKLPTRLPGLTKRGVDLLHYKQRRLQSPTSQLHHLEEFCPPGSVEYCALETAANATLVFAQEESGTAVCISKEGLLLTCSHCVAESEEELDMTRIWWLLCASGRIVQAKTVKWDPKRDLALLRIVAAQPHNGAITAEGERSPEFLFVQLADTAPRLRAPLFCIGHPGSEDLEIGRPGVATGYDVLHISEGKFRGYAKNQDRHDNSEIGALMHDCWTYWGHSGAPLIDRGNGRLVGLHSSWDDETGMRRSVGWECLSYVLDEWDIKEN